jgi:catechol-2,3-dioxygenase
MKRVTGIGGIFFKSENTDKLYGWYEKHLGIKRMPGNGVMFEWKEKESDAGGYTLWSLFSRDTKYFDPSRASFMVNYRVEDMDALLALLSEEGVEIAGREDSEYGKFAWVMDPEGNRIELYEPPKE